MGETGILQSNGTFQFGTSGVRFTQITDGLSNTLLAGEKHVPLRGFGVGWYDCSTYNGHYPTCHTRPAGVGNGLAQSLDDPGWKFGSYHTAHITQFVMADGSVQRLPASIDPVTLGLIAGRDDGQVIPEY